MIALLLLIQELPAGERELWTYAYKNRDVRAYKAYIEKYPKTLHTEEAYVSIARLLQGDEAREWFTKAFAAFPKSVNRWYYRFEAAETFVREKRPELAAAELRKIRDEAPGDNKIIATQKLWRLLEKNLELSAPKVVTAGEEPAVTFQMKDVTELKLRLRQVPWPELAENLSGNFAGALDRALSMAKPRLLREWTLTFEAGERSETIKLPAADSGVLLLDVEHDGAARGCAISVNRYELIGTVSPFNLTCLVRERATKKAVEGATLRVFQALKLHEFTSDARGQAVVRPYVDGVVQGVKDGELIAPQLSWDAKAGLPAAAHEVAWAGPFDGPLPVQAGGPYVSKFELHEARERAADLLDEAAWKRLPKEAVEKLKPDFSKERWVAVTLPATSGASGTRETRLKGVVEDVDALKIWLHTQHTGRGVPSPGGGATKVSAELRLLKLPAGPKKIVILEEARHTLPP